MLMQKSHKIRLNPDKEQLQYFRQAAGIARFVYNYGLEQWGKQYEASLVNPEAEKPTALRLKKNFNAIKRERFPFVLNVSKSVCEGAFKDLGQAFANFFRRVKEGADKPGYPNFKCKKGKKQGFYLANDRFGVEGHNLKIQKCPGIVNMAEELRFAGKIVSGRVSYDGFHWFIAIVVEVEKPEHQHEKESVGIDLGIKTFVTLSDGGLQFENKKLLKSELRKLKRLSRRLARRKIGSKRRERAKQELARFHQKIVNRRADYIHKVTTEIAKTYRIIGIEDLNVAGMVKNHKLALALSDVAFGETRRQLEYKSKWFNGLTVPIWQFFPSSKLCSVCGAIKKDLMLSDRVYVCECGNVIDRDWNASINIEVEALRMVAAMAMSTPKTDAEPVLDPSGLSVLKRQLNLSAHNCALER